MAIRESFIRLLVWTVVGVVLAGCVSAPPPAPPKSPMAPKAALDRIEVHAYPRFTESGDLAGLIRSIEMSLAYLNRLPDERRLKFGTDHYTVLHVKKSLEVFARLLKENPTEERINRIIREECFVYRSIGQKETGEVLFTGYYEPILPAGRTPTPDFSTPVHPKPQDMVEIDLSRFAADLKGRTIVGQYTGKTVIPYPSRKQIRETTDFNSMAPPIVWLRDEIDLLILQIQGSGRVELQDGTQMHILYDGSNGRPYRSIGKLLIDEGRISRRKMSMQAIRSYLRRHPENKNRIMDHNPRYIFFKAAEDGPVGALGQPLTPMRSLAVDRSVMPSAALAFITVPLAQVSPAGRILGWQPYQGFALSQDTGSAIIGPGRVDLFMGHGLQAEVGAGHLKHPGAVYFLVLKPNSALLHD